jgi:hypothetical protein
MFRHILALAGAAALVLAKQHEKHQSERQQQNRVQRNGFQERDGHALQHHHVRGHRHDGQRADNLQELEGRKQDEHGPLQPLVVVAQRVVVQKQAPREHNEGDLEPIHRRPEVVAERQDALQQLAQHQNPQLDVRQHAKDPEGGAVFALIDGRRLAQHDEEDEGEHEEGEQHEIRVEEKGELRPLEEEEAREDRVGDEAAQLLVVGDSLEGRDFAAKTVLVGAVDGAVAIGRDEEAVVDVDVVDLFVARRYALVEEGLEGGPRDLVNWGFAEDALLVDVGT